MQWCNIIWLNPEYDSQLWVGPIRDMLGITCQVSTNQRLVSWVWLDCPSKTKYNNDESEINILDLKRYINDSMIAVRRWQPNPWLTDSCLRIIETAQIGIYYGQKKTWLGASVLEVLHPLQHIYWQIIQLVKVQIFVEKSEYLFPKLLSPHQDWHQLALIARYIPSHWRCESVSLEKSELRAEGCLLAPLCLTNPRTNDFHPPQSWPSQPSVQPLSKNWFSFHFSANPSLLHTTDHWEQLCEVKHIWRHQQWGVRGLNRKTWWWWLSWDSFLFLSRANIFLQNTARVSLAEIPK